MQNVNNLNANPAPTAPTNMTVATVTKNVDLNVPEPIEVIFKRDPANNRIAVLKMSLDYSKDKEGTVSVWYENRGKELSTLPKTYYDKSSPLGESETEVMAQKFKAAFGLRDIIVKSRLGKNLKNHHSRHQEASTPVPVERRSVEAQAAQDLQLKMQILMESLPSAIGMAIQAAMVNSVMPAVTAAVDSVMKAVLSDTNGTSH